MLEVSNAQQRMKMQTEKIVTGPSICISVRISFVMTVIDTVDRSANTNVGIQLIYRNVRTRSYIPQRGMPKQQTMFRGR